MNQDDDYYRLKSLHDSNKKKNDEKYKQYSKDRLLENITKKMKTAMIGTLSIIEKEMGHLWAIGLKRQLTKQEEDMLYLWEKTRIQILDLGNNNIRMAQEEISRHTVVWDRYRYDFSGFKNKGE